MLYWIRRAILDAASLLGLLCLILAFQNCSRPDFSQIGGSASKSSGSGNGENYDGKPYVLRDLAKPCEGGETVRTRIMSIGDKFQIVREECVDLKLPKDVTADVKVDAEHLGLLTYKEKPFVLDAQWIAKTVKPNLECERKNIGPVDSVKLFVTNGAKGQTVVGVLVAGGTTYDVAFDKTTLEPTTTGYSTKGVAPGKTATITLSEFDATAPYHDGTNARFSFGSSKSNIGTIGYLFCQKPGTGKL